jgi:hypothetical protein
VPIPSAPIPQTYLPAGSLPLAAGASSSAAGVMTNEQLTTAVLDPGRMMAGVHAFLLGPQPGVAPPHPQPQLPPAPNPRQQLPSPASGTVYPYGMPQDSTAHTTAPAPAVSLDGVPIQEIQFPHSPSPLPPWLTVVAQPVYSSAPARLSVHSTPHITAGFGHGGVPVSGTLYGGVDGTILHGSTFCSAPAAAPVIGGTPSAMAPATFGAAPFQPWTYKIDFATYDGSVDPLNWLTHCEQFFWGQRTPVKQRTWMASYHLTGAAQTWYYALLLDEGMPSWERFKELCRLRFGPPIYGSRLAEVGRLPFHSTVQEFADRFQTVLAHSRDLSTCQKAKLFIGGLPKHIRVDVAMRARPTSRRPCFSPAPSRHGLWPRQRLLSSAAPTLPRGQPFPHANRGRPRPRLAHQRCLCRPQPLQPRRHPRGRTVASRRSRCRNAVVKASATTVKSSTCVGTCAPACSSWRWTISSTPTRRRQPTMRPWPHPKKPPPQRTLTLTLLWSLYTLWQASGRNKLCSCP